jgi:hypothetical protein
VGIEKEGFGYGEGGILLQFSHFFAVGLFVVLERGLGMRGGDGGDEETDVVFLGFEFVAKGTLVLWRGQVSVNQEESEICPDHQ